MFSNKKNPPPLKNSLKISNMQSATRPKYDKKREIMPNFTANWSTKKGEKRKHSLPDPSLKSATLGIITQKRPPGSSGHILYMYKKAEGGLIFAPPPLRCGAAALRVLALGARSGGCRTLRLRGRALRRGHRVAVCRRILGRLRRLRRQAGAVCCFLFHEIKILVFNVLRGCCCA